MTPAAVSSLFMPSSAIPSSSAANAYIADSWSLVKGSGPLSFVEDPLEGGGQVVLEVEYPKGSYSGAKDLPAGVGNMQMAVFGEGKQRAMVSYEVRFDPLPPTSLSLCRSLDPLPRSTGRLLGRLRLRPRRQVARPVRRRQRVRLHGREGQRGLLFDTLCVFPTFRRSRRLDSDPRPLARSYVARERRG